MLELRINAVVNLQFTTKPPTIVLGAFPVINQGDVTANLPYTSVANGANQYKIVFSTEAKAQGFVDVPLTTLPASPIVLTVPAGANSGTYSGILTVRNSITGVTGSNYLIEVTLNAVTTFMARYLNTPGSEIITLAGIDYLNNTIAANNRPKLTRRNAVGVPNQYRKFTVSESLNDTNKFAIRMYFDALEITSQSSADFLGDNSSNSRRISFKNGSAFNFRISNGVSTVAGTYDTSELDKDNPTYNGRFKLDLIFNSTTVEFWVNDVLKDTLIIEWFATNNINLLFNYNNSGAGYGMIGNCYGLEVWRFSSGTSPASITKTYIDANDSDIYFPFTEMDSDDDTIPDQNTFHCVRGSNITIQNVYVSEIVKVDGVASWNLTHGFAKINSSKAFFPALSDGTGFAGANESDIGFIAYEPFHISGEQYIQFADTDTNIRDKEVSDQLFFNGNTAIPVKWADLKNSSIMQITGTDFYTDIKIPS